MRGTGEDASERRSGLWYRVNYPMPKAVFIGLGFRVPVIEPVPKDLFNRCL